MPPDVCYPPGLVKGKDFDADWIHIDTVDPEHFA